MLFGVFSYQSLVVEKVFFCDFAVDLVFRAARPTSALAAEASKTPAKSPPVIDSTSDSCFSMDCL